MERKPEHEHPVDRDTVEQEHPGAPEQTRGTFAEGLDQKPDSPEELLEPDFARGVREGPESDTEHRGRFSEGVEELPDDPEKKVERRFSEGVERSPTSD